ncbi:MAG: hypothetical protein EBU36_04955, partial [Verrucomicrobia bacterium]|nr:hypothetical protein [Verrucomicrobiota bacterium]
GTLTVSGAIVTNNAAVAKGIIVTNGTTVLSGNNSYTGGTTVSTGTLTLSGSGTLGATTGTVRVVAGTLDLGGSARTSGAFTLDTGSLTNGTLSASSYALTNMGTISAILSGSGALTKSGTGTAVLSGANIYSGGTTVNAGTLQGNTTSLQGNITNNATLTFNQTTSGAYNGIISGSGSGSGGAVVISGSGGIVTMATNNTYVGTTTIGNGATLSSTAFGYATNTNTALTTALGIGTNTFKKYILTLDGGTVKYTGSGETNFIYYSIGTNGATFDASGSGVLLWSGGAATLVGDTNASRTITLTGTNTNNNQLASVISNSSSTGLTKVVKTGTGTWQLSGNNSTYSGGFELQQGKMAIGSTDSFGTGDVLMFDGTGLASTGTTVRTNKNNFKLGGSLSMDWLEFSNTILTNNTVILISGTNSSKASSVTFAGSGVTETGGSRSLTLNSGAGANTWATFSGANNFSGGLTLGQGMSVRLSGNGTLGATNGAVTLGNGTIDLGGLTRTNGVFTLGTGTVSNGTLTASSYALTNAGTISAALAGAGTLTKTGSGTSTLSGANSYSGGTLVSAGTLQGDTTGLQGNITNNATVSFNQTGNGTYSGLISGTGALTLDGSGIVTLSGNNNYTGRTTISSGTLRVGSTGAMGGGSTDQAVGTWLSGGNLDLNGMNLGLSTETIVMNSGTSYITNSSSTTAILGGTLFLTSSVANTFAVDSGKDINLTGSITNGSASRVLVKSGSGTLTMSGSNTNQGQINVTGGTLKIGNVAALGNATTTSNIAVSAGATLDLNGYTVASLRTITNAGGTLENSAAGGATFGNAITMTADSTYKATGNMTLSGPISGAFAFNKSGVGTVTLTGTNTYSGGTVVNNGTLAIGSNNNAISGGALTLSGGTLQTTGTSMNFSVGAVTFGGSGELQLAANGKLVSTGVVTVNGSSNFINLTAALGTYSIGNTYDLLTGTSLAGSGAISLKGLAVGGQTIALGGSSSVGRTTYSFSNT